MKPFKTLTGWLLLAGTCVLAAQGFSGFASQAEADAGAKSLPSASQSLPRDVFPDSLNRLPLVKRDALNDAKKKAYDAAAASPSPLTGLQGPVGIRLHGVTENLRYDIPVGRRLSELSIITTGREMEAQYEWTLHEEEALRMGLEPAIVDIVRFRKPLTGVGDKEAAIIQLGREMFGKHKVSSDTFARAWKLLGTGNLVDIVGLMAQYSGTGVRLTVFDQHLPPDHKPLLPEPSAPIPSDIHRDSWNRLPLIPEPPNPLANDPNRRYLAPQGTGPAQILLHGKGEKSLEASIGRRLMELAVLLTARELDQQFEWTLHEAEARKAGLEPAIIDIIRNRKPAPGLGEKETAIIQLGREVFEKHRVSSDNYANALKVFGQRDLVDLAGLLAQHTGECALLTAFDQQLPAGHKPLLPIP
jgi:4-carboxymuconolactone decarboxylase